VGDFVEGQAFFVAQRHGGAILRPQRGQRALEGVAERLALDRIGRGWGGRIVDGLAGRECRRLSVRGRARRRLSIAVLCAIRNNQLDNRRFVSKAARLR
jgi:hypothetical protein